jgi:multidrug resistance efflux pump
MKQINLFYASLIPIGIVLFVFFAVQSRETVAFYGFAETNETEINYNHPVVVDQIRVTPGQYVTRGTTLLNLSRIASKEQLQDQNYRISELLAEEAIWQREKQNELKVLRTEQQLKLDELDAQLANLQSELEYQQSLTKGLSTFPASEATYRPLLEKIGRVEKERTLLAKSYQQRIQALEDKKRMGNSPYQEQISRLEAELRFEEDHRVQPITVVAPTDGLVGNIHCKEAEHVTSFQTLISFYEPHPQFVKGYVHEDLSLKVSVGDTFQVKSLKDETIAYPGVVTGLGSRVIEIPERLRKIPEVRTYGREVTIKIAPENNFLQKEKVALELVARTGEKVATKAQIQN